MRLSYEQARNIFDAVGAAGAAVAALGEAATLDAKGELSSDELIDVVEDYLRTQERLKIARDTRGAISE